MTDPFELLRKTLARTILRSPAHLDAEVRARIARNDETLPEALSVLVRKIHTAAHTCTDDDVKALLAHGYSQDQAFELIASAALGAATRRATIALDLLDGGQRAPDEG